MTNDIHSYRVCTVTAAKLIFDQKVSFSEGRYEVRIVAYTLPKSKKYPDGVKLRCILLDLQENIPRLLLDNHEPFGYHLHTKMPHDKAYRIRLEVMDYEKAIEFFMGEVPKVINDEN